MIVEDQSEVAAFLSRPETYGLPGGLPGEAVERVETHASIVFLAGDRAFKLKRAVRFPYLDYSTLDRRRHFCEAEVSTNRRIAPDLYVGVVPVVRRNGGLALGGDGTPVDWLVEMRRFDQTLLFDRLATGGRLDRYAMESLADTIARFHRDAERCPASGGADGVRRVLDSNRESFAECRDVLPAGQVARLVERAQRVLEQVTPLLERRRDDGSVRHCHGDLHLGNIVAHDGSAVLFDAIEFDPAFAEIDVLYDIAFLVMDLDFRRLGTLASIALNRYLDNTGDAAGLPVLPLFLSMRAAIRSHVQGVAAGCQSRPAAAERLAADARRYLDLALGYLERPSPRVVAVGGLSGTGKSALARELAPFLPPGPGARVVRTDATRKRLAGVTLGTRLAGQSYTPETSRQTYEAVFDEARVALAAGCSVIADAVFARPEERQRIESIAAEAGAPFLGVWLEADPRLLETRVRGRRNNVSDATPEVVRLQLSYDLGSIGWMKVDTSGESSHALDAVLSTLGFAR